MDKNEIPRWDVETLDERTSSEGRWVLFTDHERVVAELENYQRVTEETLAAKHEMIDSLRAEADALRKDAERYRWLRSWNVGMGELDRCIFETVHDDCNPPYRAMKYNESLDRAIDSAMGAKA